jgi:DNA-binding response OmpR family regulator
MDEYIAKPFRPEELLDVITRTLRHIRQNKAT